MPSEDAIRMMISICIFALGDSGWIKGLAVLYQFAGLHGPTELKSLVDMQDNSVLHHCALDQDCCTADGSPFITSAFSISATVATLEHSSV